MKFLEIDVDADQKTLILDLLNDLPVHRKVVLVETRSGLEVMPQDIGIGILLVTG